MSAAITKGAIPHRKRGHRMSTRKQLWMHELRNAAWQALLEADALTGNGEADIVGTSDIQIAIEAVLPIIVTTAAAETGFTGFTSVSRVAKWRPLGWRIR